MAKVEVLKVFSEKNGFKTNGKFGGCRRCKKPFRRSEDKCLCQEWLCFRCCQCDSDCELCSCKHKRKNS